MIIPQLLFFAQAIRVLDLLRDILWMAIIAFAFMYIPHFVASTRSILPCVKKRYIRGEKAGAAQAMAPKEKPAESEC